MQYEKRIVIMGTVLFILQPVPNKDGTGPPLPPSINVSSIIMAICHIADTSSADKETLAGKQDFAPWNPETKDTMGFQPVELHLKACYVGAAK